MVSKCADELLRLWKDDIRWAWDAALKPFEMESSEGQYTPIHSSLGLIVIPRTGHVPIVILLSPSMLLLVTHHTVAHPVHRRDVGWVSCIIS